MTKLLKFPPIPAGRSMTQPHGLRGTPDFATVSGPHAGRFIISFGIDTVMIKNTMRVARRVNVLVERWERSR